MFKTKRQEAKAAADAAAAAAADACAVCDKLYGDDSEKDDNWIACDRCNRWYHGSCVDLTQVMTCYPRMYLPYTHGRRGCPFYTGPLCTRLRMVACASYLLLSSIGYGCCLPNILW